MSGLSGAASWPASIKSLSVRGYSSTTSPAPSALFVSTIRIKSARIVNLQDLYYQNNRDHQRLVHKRKKANILITSPEQRDEDSYCARLILQDASELLCDHQTGQHIQGMVLIEAARQTIIATSEKFLLAEAGVAMAEKYFTLSSLQVAFSCFVFPLPVTIVLNVCHAKVQPMAALPANARGVDQTGTRKAEVGFSFSVYDLNYITRKECEQAAQCHQHYLVSMSRGTGMHRLF
ncbi:AfsA-related hotdog domain-containing protein [Klebsiella quasipneumoniae]|uniref:AfsA-related hotdog domain-containing protein n=1 Tax=Klebsiella quasipneumoniae TaxID=1463165 RepID=UPI003720AB4E